MSLENILKQEGWINQDDRDIGFYNDYYKDDYTIRLYDNNYVHIWRKEYSTTEEFGEFKKFIFNSIVQPEELHLVLEFLKNHIKINNERK